MATQTLDRPVQAEPQRTERTRSMREYRPNVDIIENAQELIVHADMPGVRASDVDVDFENGTLSIHGRVAERQGEGTPYLLREYGIGDFHRTFQVSESIDTRNITAEMADGVLVLRLPKVETARPRKIKVQG